MHTTIADSKDLIKSEVIAWVKSEMPKAPLFQQKDIVASTLAALSRGPFAKDSFSPDRQVKFVYFQKRFEALQDKEISNAENAIGEFLLNCSERLGGEGVDSSGLPNLLGSYKEVSWAFVLRADWFHGLTSVESVNAAIVEIQENTSAQYWITKLK